MLAVIRKVLPYLRPYRGPFVIAFVEALLLSGLELLKPWPLKVIIDNVLGGTPLGWEFLSGWPQETLLLVACVAIVVIYLLSAAISLHNNYTTIRVGQAMVHDIRGDLNSHLQRLSLAFHSRRQVGDLLYRVTGDTYAIQTLTMNGLFSVLKASLLLCGIFAVTVQFDWLLTLLAISVCPALLVVISVLEARVSSAAVAARQQESVVYSLVQRAMSSIRVIQAFAKEEEEHRRFMAASQASLGANLRLYTLQISYEGVIGLVTAIGTALVVWVGARQVLSGALTVGALVVFASYLASLYGPINSIVLTYGGVQAARAGLERVFEILDAETAMAEGERVFPPEGAQGDVAFDAVSFHYAPGQPVLQGVELHARKGQRIAFVGHTGAGKSTLVSLLPRFYDPQVGRVLLDGIDVREFRLKELRRQIAMVLQPPLVFQVTIREFIAYSRPDARLDEVMSTSRIARVHYFIEQLPQGYDTILGEQGATLSEGEKQRLTIARAILLKAPILILDEPTSAVDAETEASILEGLEQLLAGKTTFIIAHRLSTVREAELIVVVHEGRIVERGTFTELLARDGPFRRLYRTQWPEERRAAEAL